MHRDLPPQEDDAEAEATKAEALKFKYYLSRSVWGIVYFVKKTNKNNFALIRCLEKSRSIISLEECDILFVALWAKFIF